MRLEKRRLGSSSLEVSELSLGSWRTYERIPRDTGLEVMRRAREVGINFLDDARYNDETGAAPLKTGYSEVVFGELFRASRWPRDEVVVANKLWWEFWPQQNAAEELDASLQRMGLDYIDLIYAERLPEGLSVVQAVDQVSGLIKSGKVRAWGVLNWHSSFIRDAARVARETNQRGPCAAQLPYSVAYRSPVEDDDMIRALDDAGASVVASFTLAGGALTGKYARPGATGRLTSLSDSHEYKELLAIGQTLGQFATQKSFRPTPLAIAFTLANPRVASVLFGATSVDQLDENLAAAELVHGLDVQTLEELRTIGTVPVW